MKTRILAMGVSEVVPLASPAHWSWGVVSGVCEVTELRSFSFYLLPKDSFTLQICFFMNRHMDSLYCYR